MRRSLLASLCLLLIAAEPAPELVRAARNVRAVIAHRGSSSDRPENTLAAYRQAIAVGATFAEVDVRTTKVGVLVSLHDADVSRSTDGKGQVSDMTLAELSKLDAGSKFAPQFKGERIPTLRDILELCRGKIGVLLDLKETRAGYVEQIVAEVRQHGQPKEIVVGVRTVAQARQFRQLLPEARQIGLIPTQQDIAAFAQAGVDAIRLWPKWLDDKTLVPAVRQHKCQLLLGTAKGTREEVVPLLVFSPEWLSSDDPARLQQTLTELGRK